MYPVLFSINKFPVSSYGVFLALGFIVGLFLIWRLARAWDMDEEKILDLTLLTFLGGFAGARIFFVISNLTYFFQHPIAIILFYKMPGFALAGGLLGGFLTLYITARKKKMDFLQAADFAAVGFVAGSIFESLGCFLAACEIGRPSNIFFAVEMAGYVGKRFPVQALQALFLTATLHSLWRKSIHFHPKGKILALSLIYLGGIKLFTQIFKDSQSQDLIFSLLLIILGIKILYKATNRKITVDLKDLILFSRNFLTDSLTRQKSLDKLSKIWYNRKTTLVWNLVKVKRSLRRFNVRISFKNHKLY